ncbi:MAG: phage tail protein [Bacteroidota bacterium]
MGFLSNLLPSDYPPSAFYFKVVFSVTGAGGMVDTSFKEVSGITSKMETDGYHEGGENRFEHALPKVVKTENLILKRGIAPLSSPLVVWCKSIIESSFMVPITPQPMMVYLMDENKIPLRAWSFSNAFPVSWEVESFDSMKNEVAIEKIELSYTYSNRLM